MLDTAPISKPGSERVTDGVRVSVWPTFLANQSDPADRRYVFAYRIRITNESNRAVRLKARHWQIIDADGHRKEVDGEGVVGQQPVIEPGQTFEYSSLCPARDQLGHHGGSVSLRVRSR